MDNSIAFQKDWLQNRDTIKKNVKRIIREWKSTLDMSNWTFEITFNKDDYAATCFAEPEYRNAYINFFLKRISAELKTNYELEEFVVHEMIHCLTWNLVGMTERLINTVGDPTNELWTRKINDEELFVQRMSDALVMSKYNLKSIPESVKLRPPRRDRIAKEWKKRKLKSRQI